ncbi:CoA pyrophosphatase [Gulosibacter sp. 10]|uniref:NUDIX hydrolase n=1 Tax=Gulosibacter sp. 10 TaxID=1255570 RepID=UPI00097EF89D|nr:CoA pyrophosphatase [Gulosibacter sp. 10]SJM61076.1 Hypothetical nudix hydrolase YeaB [Gulosibacter sp. 10]
MDAKRDLREVLRRGLSLDLRRHGPAEPLVDAPLRKSAVLMLFGPSPEPSAGASGSASGGDGLDVLLTRRSPRMRHHPGQIAFPGGGIEPADDGPEAAALREAAEETGVDPHGIEMLGSLPEVYLPVSNNLVTPVLGWWRTPGETVADARETVEVARVSVARLLDPGCRGTSVLEFGGAVHRGPAFRFRQHDEDRIVWGFTGILLSTVFELAGWERPWDASRIIPVAR